MNRPSTAVLSVFVAVVLIGGTNFVAVRFSNRELPPFWGAGLRFAIAGLLLVGFAAWRRIRLPLGSCSASRDGGRGRAAGGGADGRARVGAEGGGGCGGAVAWALPRAGRRLVGRGAGQSADASGVGNISRFGRI